MLWKKITSVLIAAILTLLLAACGEKEVPVDPGVITYPGLTWNMTQEDVVKALDIDEKGILPNGKKSSPQQQVFCVENWEFLGEKGTALFEFYNFGTDRAEDYFGLRRVVVFYPESADIDSLEKELNAMLGEGKPVRDGKWLIWESEKMCAEYMEEALAEMKVWNPDRYEEKLKWGEATCVSHVTLHYNAEDGAYMNLAPYEGWDGTGITVSFYSNHLDLLQYAEFGMNLPE